MCLRVRHTDFRGQVSKMSVTDLGNFYTDVLTHSILDMFR